MGLPNVRPEGNSSLMSKRFPKTLRNSRTIIISPNSSDGSFIMTGMVFGRSCKPFKHVVTIILSQCPYLINVNTRTPKRTGMYQMCAFISTISRRPPIRILLLLVQYFLSICMSLFFTLSHTTNLLLTKLAQDCTETISTIYPFGTDFVALNKYYSRFNADILPSPINSPLLASKM